MCSSTFFFNNLPNEIQTLVLSDFNLAELHRLLMVNSEYRDSELIQEILMRAYEDTIKKNLPERYNLIKARAAANPAQANVNWIHEYKKWKEECAIYGCIDLLYKSKKYFPKVNNLITADVDDDVDKKTQEILIDLNNDLKRAWSTEKDEIKKMMDEIKTLRAVFGLRKCIRRYESLTKNENYKAGYHAKSIRLSIFLPFLSDINFGLPVSGKLEAAKAMFNYLTNPNDKNILVNFEKHLKYLRQGELEIVTKDVLPELEDKLSVLRSKKRFGLK